MIGSKNACNKRKIAKANIQQSARFLKRRDTAKYEFRTFTFAASHYSYFRVQSKN